jgi:hypothetical protein
VIQEPKKILPSVIIYNVESDVKEEDIKNDIIHKNFDLDINEQEKLKDKTLFKFKFKTKENKINWVI